MCTIRLLKLISKSIVPPDNSVTKRPTSISTPQISQLWVIFFQQLTAEMNFFMQTDSLHVVRCTWKTSSLNCSLLLYLCAKIPCLVSLYVLRAKQQYLPSFRYWGRLGKLCSLKGRSGKLCGLKVLLLKGSLSGRFGHLLGRNSMHCIRSTQLSLICQSLLTLSPSLTTLRKMPIQTTYFDFSKDNSLLLNKLRS